MSDITVLLRRINERGISLSIEGDSIKCKAPESVLTAEVLEELRVHKPTIIRHLETVREQMRQALIDLYTEIGHGCTSQDWHSLCATPSWRETVFAFEEAFTEAWQNGEDFREELGRLREYWLTGLKAVRGIGLLHGGVGR